MDEPVDGGGTVGVTPEGNAPAAGPKPSTRTPRSGIRKALVVVAWTVVATVVLAVASVVVLFAMLFNGGFGDRSEEPGEPRPLTYLIDVPAGWTNAEPRRLDLDPRDVDALGVQPTLVAEPRDEFVLETKIFKDEVRGWGYCLVGDAAVTTVATGSVAATIPAGTCLGTEALVVPIAEEPDVVAHPETWPVDPALDTVELAGMLVIGIDGCSRIGDTRLIWSGGTTIDAAGSVVLDGHPPLANGSMTVLSVVRDPVRVSRISGWCAPSDDVAFVTGGVGEAP